MVDKEMLEAMAQLLQPINDRLLNLEQGQVQIQADIKGIKSDIATMQEDIEIIKEDVAVTRVSVNELLAWADNPEWQQHPLIDFKESKLAL